MSAITRASNTNTTFAATAHRGLSVSAALFAIMAGTAGTAVGFIAAFAVAIPMLHQTLATETASLNSKLASSVTPTDVSCAQVTPAGVVLGTSTGTASVAPSQPSGGQGGMGGNTFIKKLIGGQLATTTGTIADTGPNSSNEIVTKNTSITTVTNDNDISLSTSNDQQASSGVANVSDNTNAGSAATGDAQNVNSTSLSVTVNN